MNEDKRSSIFDEYLSIANALRAKGALDLEMLDLSGISGFADVFIIATAASDVNARTLRDTAEDAMEIMGIAYKIEGENSSRWSLIDGGDVVVHIFSKDGRSFYNLDRNWGDAPILKIRDNEEE